MADGKITIRLNGRRQEGAGEPLPLPALLGGASRSHGEVADDFLPPDYLTTTAVFDVGGAARSAEGGAPREERQAADPGEVVVLELEDGSTLITSAQRLHDSLQRSHPQWWKEGDDPDSIPFEKLRAEGAGAHRGFGEAVGGLVSKVFTLVAGEKKDAIAEAAIGWLKNRGLSPIELGATWLGTKALMWAVESRLFEGHDTSADKDASGWLYQWIDSTGDAKKDFKRPEAAALAKAVADKQPMLVFVHGTGSSSLGSFSELQAGDASLWTSLKDRFTGGIYAFEHRTLSASPIENALDLAKALPEGACVSLVSHSRGGLIADLLCLSGFDRCIEEYKRASNVPGVGEDEPGRAVTLAAELERDAYAEQRIVLRDLAALLQKKRFVVQRYVRVAAPANGTKLASGNFDVFLSGLLSLIGKVPFFFGNPYYAAFKRVVIEIAKNRTNPRRVPGIEAMLPDSPMAQLLRDAPVAAGIEMAVIAGDIEGGGMLKRLGVLLTDFLLFDRDDNDLVVNTTAMLAGIAPRAISRVLFDRGADVSHFRYFVNVETRTALRDWLVSVDVARVDVFHPLPKPEEYAEALAAATRDVAGAADRPIVVVLPGVMGSHLQVGGKDRVWFDPLDIASGGLAKVAWGKPGVEAEELFGMFYGKLCERLAESHRVETFAYDWRQPLDVLGERLGEVLDRLMKESKQPIRLLAHSMGGLVVRACIHKRRPVMDALMLRDGARLVMLGTPNQGAHSMVENLIGKGDTLRTLVRLDVTHSMQEVLDIVAGFRGALQLLPKPGFRDQFQGQSDGGGFFDYQKVDTWETVFRPVVKDFWFGDNTVARLEQGVLDSASWLWQQDGDARPALPPEYEKKSCYVFGCARNTPCGVRIEGGRLRMVGTPHGDGTVSWESGRIGNIGQFFYMPAEHGDLPATTEHFPAIVELLTTGATSRLSATPPVSRAIEQPQPVAYDAGPPSAEDPDMIGRALLGGSLRNRVPPRRKRRLEVRVHAKDLRFLSQPILVGHYAQDPIAGPQRVIDRELLGGDLSERHSLGLYAGPLGTATVVLRVPNEAERTRGSLRGAVVTGLGPYDGSLSMTRLTEAVRAGALRYLLQVVDVIGKTEREVSLATLLIGYNSSANLTVEASVEALVRGVMEANARFFDATRLNIRIGRLDIVELYIDTAITAVYSLRHIESRLASLAERQQTQLVCANELQRGEGRRQRLFDAGANSAYWPRLVITGLDEEQRRAALAAGRAPATMIADRLKFLYVGQRARAESVQLQRQPGLIEQLVRQQIHDRVWRDDFGRMLFQLMVPHDFKDAARQLDQVVLVVDETTANLPWELMLADDPSRTDEDKRPLALRMAAVRQLTTSEYRGHVRQNIERSALVIGNPSVKGFGAAFTPPAPAALAGAPAPVPMADPPALPGAKAEAEAVARVLEAMGYQVTPLIDGHSAAAVLAAMYRRPWRLLHISAHGVFALPHPDGLHRSGVVLSDGLLITAAEIAAMEVVPDLVFLNCCHLGTVDIGRQGNKLAASVASELIRIGVRCVVVAGWAVDDEGARLFGETFYTEMLLRRRAFGEAVLEARKAVYARKPEDITWGAFQAYGDPTWRAEPRAAGVTSDSGPTFASPEELLDELARIRAQHSRRADVMNDRDLHAQVEALESMMKNRCPPGWRAVPGVQSALGATFLDLGEFERAREALLEAVQAEDKDGTVPIHDIERLANIEARLAERILQDKVAEFDSSFYGVYGADLRERDKDETADWLIESAIGRLVKLDELVAAKGKPPFNPERSQLLGSAYKRKANLYATLILHADRMASSSRASKQDVDAARARAKGAPEAMVLALQKSVKAYGRDEGRPSSGVFAAHLALNRLALDALTPWVSGSDQAAAVELAHQARNLCTARYQITGNPWDAVMQADAMLIEMLIDGRLGEPGDSGNAALSTLTTAYLQTLANLTLKPREFDSIVSQMVLLSRFCDALWIAQRDNSNPMVRASAANRWRTAARLLELRQRLRPGARPREDRPRGPVGEPAAIPPAEASRRKRAQTRRAKSSKR